MWNCKSKSSFFLCFFPNKSRKKLIFKEKKFVFWNQISHFPWWGLLFWINLCLRTTSRLEKHDELRHLMWRHNGVVGQLDCDLKCGILGGWVWGWGTRMLVAGGLNGLCSVRVFRWNTFFAFVKRERERERLKGEWLPRLSIKIEWHSTVCQSVWH
jgi:hypothetical protein